MTTSNGEAAPAVRIRPAFVRDAAVALFALLLVGMPAIGGPRSLLAQQTASLGGVVLEAASRVPIAGATIRVAGAAESAVTDGNGRFLLYDLLPGRRIIEISYLGRAAEPRAIRLVENRHAEVEVAVDLAALTSAHSAEDLPDRASVIPLEDLDVEVTGSAPGKLQGFYDRMENADGVFIDRAQILGRDPSRPSDLLRGVSGIRVNARTFERESVLPSRGRQGQFQPCRLLYFLDGLEVPGFDIDDVPARDLAGIEVYRSLSEIPPQFRRRGVCAVIVLWTRDPAVPDPEVGS